MAEALECERRLWRLLTPMVAYLYICRRKGWQRMRWHHRLDGHELEWTPGVSDGQGGLACCDSWGRKESDTTERLNWNELIHIYIYIYTHTHRLIDFLTFSYHKSSFFKVCLFFQYVTYFIWRVWVLFVNLLSVS